MPGLGGTIRKTGVIDDPEGIIRKILRVHRLNDISYEERTFSTNCAVITNVLTGLIESTRVQPAVSHSGDVVLFLEGEIFNTDDFRSRAQAGRNLSQCDLLLNLFELEGPEFVSHLNGEFNIVVFETKEKRLTIFSDHIASMPMYFSEDRTGLSFGSEKKTILAIRDHSPDIDPVGILQIVAHRHNLDERTYLSGIRRMMAGTELVYQEGKLSSRHYPRAKFQIAVTDDPVRVVVDKWSEHLIRATNRRIRGERRVLMSLSGGLDSRAVACAFPREARPIVSRTRGHPDDRETELAAQIAERLGFVHLAESPEADSYSKSIPGIVWRTECEVHFTNGISFGNHALLKEHGDFIAGGWLGDISSGGHISPWHLVRCTRHDFIERLFRRYLAFPRSTLDRIFAVEFLEDSLPKLKEAFVRSFDAIDAETNVQMFESWDLAQRQRRMTTASMPVDSYAFEKIRPFYDREYLEFAFSLPLRYRFGQTFYQAMIHRLGPEIVDIPNANTGFRLSRSVSRNAVNSWVSASRRMISKAAEIAKLKKVDHGINDRLADGIVRDIGFRRLIEGFLESNVFESAIFSKQGIQTMLDEQYGEGIDRSYELGYVATFAAGLPYFLKKTEVCPAEAQPNRSSGPSYSGSPR